MSDDVIPLAMYRGLHTDDVDEAREWVGRALRPHRMVPLGAGVHVVHHMADLGETSFQFIDYGGDVAIEVDSLGFVLVQIPLAGSASIRAGRREVIATPEVAAVTAPTGSLRMRYFASNPRVMVRIPQQLIEARVALMLGGRPKGPLSFDLALDLSSNAGRSWRGLVDTIVSDLDRGGPISRSPLAAASLELAVVDGLLSVHHNSYSDRIHYGEATPRPRTLQRALSLMEQHCAEPLTTADIAEAVGVSVRSLQEGFQHHVGVTPMAYLRAVRMRRIHEELLAGREGTSVTEVALRWGIIHAGRFAQEYRKMFGQSPSETLRRSR